MYMFIYKITNKITNKIYIGQTTRNPYIRWNKHQRISLNPNNKDFSFIHSSIRKYGVDNFTFDVIDTAENKEELNEKEIYYIKKFNSMAPNGYNLTSGGQSPRVLSERTRKLLSETKLGALNPNYGKHPSEETRKKLVERNNRRYASKEARLKTSISAKEVWSRPGFKEKMIKERRARVTDEFRKKISEHSKKMWQDPVYREKMKKIRTKKSNVAAPVL